MDSGEEKASREDITNRVWATINGSLGDRIRVIQQRATTPSTNTYFEPHLLMQVDRAYIII